ncbi:MAG: EamA family transporter [Eubacteriales bacterium]|nr:EamA family transporter [Lachnospiraceae bacterium]MDO5127492.1 EamA family transporter [Eubacteriales bacterium]
MNKERLKTMLLLHILLFLYSLGAIAAKLAGQQEFMSAKFIFFYGIVLVGLLLYALFWQQILKRVSLITAYANKAVTIIWGVLWGKLIFEETITVWNIIGSMIVICGVYMVVSADEE